MTGAWSAGREDETQGRDEVKSNMKPEKVEIRSVDTGLATKVRWFLHKCEQMFEEIRLAWK